MTFKKFFIFLILLGIVAVGCSSKTESPEKNIEEKVFCEVCNAEMFEKHCKIICPNCGFKWDCSDH